MSKLLEASKFLSFVPSSSNAVAAVYFSSKVVLRVSVTFEYSASFLASLALVTDPLINFKKIKLKIKLNLFFKLN
ncbi:hypothetical protein [Mycoplasmopsis synoviae]|uniref:hypothetical protein n=1 Tax=Mycoplasmopsis synoviae TaxID=2109 RepID=UPI001CE129FA|nr:hypothetical protein [Mycoplasmopsis synoviae]